MPTNLVQRAHKKLQAGDFKAAANLYKQALKDSPDSAPLHLNLGICLIKLGDKKKALSHFHRAVALDNNFTLANYNLANALKQTSDVDAALKYYQKTIQINPEFEPAYHELASLYFRLRNFKAVINLLEENITLTNQSSNLSHLLAESHKEAGSPTTALDWFIKAHHLDRDNATYLHEIIKTAYHTNAWDIIDQYNPLLDQVTDQELENSLPITQSPLTQLMRSSDPYRNLEVARGYSRRYPVNVPPPSRKPHRLIELAYLSSDFRDHVIGHHIRHLCALHDRRRFHVTLLSNHPGDGSPIHQEIKRSADRYIDLTQPHTLDPIRNLKLDIVIDLNGHTEGDRLPLLANRLAPIQVSYLGFPGTTGTTFYDYLISDPVLTPPDYQDAFTEKLVLLDRCYLVSSYPKKPKKVTTRAAHHLPQNAFVFCSFSGSYKITRPMFDTWLRLLKAVPESVLWLWDNNLDSKTNLTQYFVKNGLDPQRLIFAPRLSYTKHLERLHHADLALDTFPYGGGATSSNALFMGVPVITIEGTHYPSRMGTSMLTHLNLQELIAKNHHEYYQKALELASNPSLLNNIHKSIILNHKSSNIFDTTAFTHSLEQAYELIWQQYINGQLPRLITL